MTLHMHLTAVWRCAVPSARNEGRRVLLARPAAEEENIPLSGLIDLLEDLPSDNYPAEAIGQKCFCTGSTSTKTTPTGQNLLERALREVSDDDPLRGRLLDLLGWNTGMFSGDLERGLHLARQPEPAR